MVLPATASVLPVPRIDGADSHSPGNQPDVELPAEVLHVFSSGFYLAVDAPHDPLAPGRRLLPVMGPAAMELPFGIVVPELSSEHLATLRNGTRATVILDTYSSQLCDAQSSETVQSAENQAPPRRIDFPAFCIDIVREHRPLRLKAESWPPIDLLRIDALNEHLRIGSSDLPGLARELASALLFGDVRGTEAGVSALLGRGPGSTPSGDDALCGIALALHSTGETRPLSLLTRALDAFSLTEMTPAVSAALIRAAVSGHCVPEVAAAIRAARALLSAPTADESLVSAVLTPLNRIGHSSGSDLFTGLLAILASFGPLSTGTLPAHSFSPPNSPAPRAYTPRSLTQHSSKGTLPCHAH